MTKKMLIDATHEEETRVAVTDGNKLVEYDYESQTRKSLKGSIYLAKVTRVEPSLQAAFVNFGGNRHGFLPFSEIHPDYFRIPISDREALIAEQEALLAEHDEEEEALDEDALEDEEGADDADDESEDEASDDAEADDSDDDSDSDSEEDSDENASEDDENAKDDKSDGKGKNQRRGRGRGRRGRGKRSNYRNKNVEVVGGHDVDDEQKFRFNLRRKYKIQEVVKRGQIMLVQANKEERGNKGAAVGTYLSLPGRYCVLMPNSPRAGGVSRKIANHKDRARMREIVKDLEVPKGMSVIVRTAGVTRTKAEIKRDLDYLMRLWNNIRELTLESSAPALVYEEANLIKRSVRDLYTRDIEEIIVAGENGHKTAKDFMKMLIPSHVKKVKRYEDIQLPLFNRYQIENQIDEIGQMEVRLKSGGYLVINPTEALVSVDVNSGKSTKGRHIEETALKTNLEAADEVARQLKLRDLGGLVVIDFIDMENRRNNGKVERRMKEALSTDRARVQVGRISSFGLMELSRQRLSPSLTEAQYEKCPTCAGSGVIRTADAMSILVLRMIEDEGIRKRAAEIIVEVTANVAMYLINHKREKITEIEERYGLKVLLRVDDDIPASECRIEVSKPAERNQDSDNDEAESEASDNNDRNEKGNNERRRGRRGGRGRGRNNKKQDDDQSQDQQKDQKNDDESSQDEKDKKQDKSEKKSSRSKKKDDSDSDAKKGQEEGDDSKKTSSSDQKDEKGSSDKPKRKRSSRSKSKPDSDDQATKTTNDNVKDEGEDKSDSKSDKDDNKKASQPAKAKADEKTSPKTPAKSKAKTPAKKAQAKDSANDAPKEYEVVNEAPKEKKKGWWNRLVE